MADNLITFRVIRDPASGDPWAEPQTKNMALYPQKDGKLRLGIYKTKTKGFVPVGQWEFPTVSKAMVWAQQAWECGENFDV